jgi:chemotaxis protein MotB
MLYRTSASSTNDADFAETALLGLEWAADDRDETWIISYADILSVILAMVVLLFGRMAMTGATQGPITAEASAAEVVVELTAPIAADTVVEPAAPLAVDTVVEIPPAVAADALVELPAQIAADAVADAAAENTPATTQPTREDRLASLVEERFNGRIKAEQRKEGMLLTIPEVALFDSARAQLQSSASPLLTELAATLREVGEARISVQGHTDSRPVQGGEFSSNWDLAAARANAVTRYLLDRGFDPTRLHSVAYADTRPMSDNGTAEGRAANRRVELEIEFVGADEGLAAP